MENDCGVYSSGGYVCTLEANHTGPHRATGVPCNHCGHAEDYGSWPKEVDEKYSTYEIPSNACRGCGLQECECDLNEESS